MSRKRLQSQPNAELPVDLDAWADALVATTPDTLAGMRAVAKRLADNARLSAEDREFAKSQLAAIQRAVRRSRKCAQKHGTKY